MPEIREPGSALPEREFEGRNRRERRPQTQNLQQLASRAVGGDDPLTKTVGKEWSFRAIVRRKAGHDSPTLCNHKTNAPILKNGRKSLSDWYSGDVCETSMRDRRLQGCQRPSENCKRGRFCSVNGRRQGRSQEIFQHAYRTILSI
jgi:hypothetical protein